MKVFTDRFGAGLELAPHLESLAGQDVIVLGLARGGMPVAFEVAERLEAPLDILLVRQLPVPGRPGLSFGTIGEGGARLIDDAIVQEWHLGQDEIAQIEARQRSDLRRRAKRLRGDRDRISLTGRVAVIVDDGMSLSTTAKAACRIARARGARKVIVAAPTAPGDVKTMLAGYADDVVCVDTPAPTSSLRREYRHLPPVPDSEVATLLRRAGRGEAAVVEPDTLMDVLLRDEEVQVSVAGNTVVTGIFTVPEHATGVVVFAHGSSSSRHSPRNRLVARVLNHAGLATLISDLLTPEEARNRAHVFDVDLLARRLIDVTRWLEEQSDTASLPVGYFGTNTGAAAALTAAADPRAKVDAVVSRGGRPDLADDALTRVVAPTQLIVGGRDHVVLKLNKIARAAMPGTCEIAVVPGATHVFEEPGTLEEVAELARDWFIDHLGDPQDM